MLFWANAYEHNYSIWSNNVSLNQGKITWLICLVKAVFKKSIESSWMNSKQWKEILWIKSMKEKGQKTYNSFSIMILLAIHPSLLMIEHSIDMCGKSIDKKASGRRALNKHFKKCHRAKEQY